MLVFQAKVPSDPSGHSTPQLDAMATGFGIGVSVSRHLNAELGTSFPRRLQEEALQAHMTLHVIQTLFVLTVL